MSEVLLETQGHVATLTLNRPDRMNAISVTMLGEPQTILVVALQ